MCASIVDISQVKNAWRGTSWYHSLPLILEFAGCFLTRSVVTWKWTWWRHQRETFSTLLALCAGNSPVTGEFPSQRPVTWSFNVFFDLHLNKRLSKQSWFRWFETPLRSLWRHCNEHYTHFSGVTWASWPLKSPATILCVQQLVQVIRMTKNNLSVNELISSYSATYIYALVNRVGIVSDNGLSPIQRQAII